MLESILRAHLRAYSQAGWDRAIECHWDRLGGHGRQCTSECTRKSFWEHTMECIWQFGCKVVECSIIYSIKRIYFHAYCSNLVDGQVYRTYSATCQICYESPSQKHHLDEVCIAYGNISWRSWSVPGQQISRFHLYGLKLLCAYQHHICLKIGAEMSNCSETRMSAIYPIWYLHHMWLEYITLAAWVSSARMKTTWLLLLKF